MRSFTIKKNANKKTKVKYPYRIYLDNGRIIPLPSQHNFKSDYIRNHGCSLVGFYMALRFVGVKKNMTQCKKYLDKNYELSGHSKYSLRQISKAINAIASGSPATFKKVASVDNIQKALDDGKMVLFEERNPIHTAVLLEKSDKCIRFSDGKYKRVTVAEEIKKRCGDAYYGGCIIVGKR